MLSWRAMLSEARKQKRVAEAEENSEEAAPGPSREIIDKEAIAESKKRRRDAKRELRNSKTRLRRLQSEERREKNIQRVEWLFSAGDLVQIKNHHTFVLLVRSHLLMVYYYVDT